MKPNAFLRRFLAIAGSAVLTISYSHAADGTWISTTAGPFNWSNGPSWTSGTIADGDDFTAFFTANITANQVVNLDTARTIGNITFTDSTTASNDLTISGANILTLSRTDATAPIINVTNRTLTISSEIAGNDGLTKDGAGTLVLSRSTTGNTYTGTTTLTAGTLQANTGTSLIASIANPLGTSALQLNGGTLQLRSDNAASGSTADTIAWNNNTTVGGNVTINVQRVGGSGSNKIHQLGTLSIGAHTLTASDGGTENHDLRFGATTLTGNATFNVTNGGTGAMNLILGAVGESGSRSLSKSGSGTLTITGIVSNTGGASVSAGTLSLTNASNSFSGGLTISGGALNTGSSAASAYGNNRITFTGSGTLGAFNGSAGTATVTQTGGITVDPTFIATISVASTAWQFSSSGTLLGSGTVRGSGASASGVMLNFTNTGNTFTGTLDTNTGVTATGGFNVASLGDGGQVILGSSGTSASTFSLLSNGVATSFNTRQFVMSTVGAYTANINNDATAGSSTLTIGTNFSPTASGAKILSLGGTNSGAVNIFSGGISTGSATSLALTKAGATTWILSGNNSYTGVTTISGGVLNVSILADGSNNSSIGASSNVAGNLVLNGGTLRYAGGAQNTDRLFSLQVSSSLDASGTGAVNFTNTGSMGFNGGVAAKTLTLTGRNTGNNTLAAAIANNTGATSIAKTGIGTWVLSGTNSATGTSSISGGGTLVLDYATAASKLSSGVLNLSSGGNVTLKGGSFTQTVASTTINGGGNTYIAHDTGTSKIAFGAITRTGSGGATVSLEDDTIATTTSVVVNGILSGGIFVGDNYAKVSGGNIVALSPGDYTALTAAVTTNTVNYQLTGSLSRGAASLNSLRIVGDGNDQVLTITSGNLTPSLLSDAGTPPVGRYSGNSATGGILYAGGGNNNYTITGSGNVQAQNGNQELIIHTHTGTLTVDMALTMGSSILTKSGAGTLALTKSGSYTGATWVNQGALQLRNNTAAGTIAGGITVQNGAALELANSVAIGAEALTITGTGMSNAGALRNVASNTSSYAGAITLGAGGARINSDASGTLTLTGGVVTSLFNNVTFGGAGNITVSTAAISGAGGLTKDGAGKTTLTATNTYTGATTISQGTLEVSAGNINSTSSVAINGGEFKYGSSTGLTRNVTVAGGNFRYNSSVAYSGTLTFTSGTISGTNLTGSLGGQTIGTGQTVAPGNSPGTASTTSQTWAGGGSYAWEINDVDAGAGTDPGWDLINGSGSLTITATSGSQFNLLLSSLAISNLAGNVHDFSSAGSYNWLIADFASITGFDPDAFNINTTGFTNTFTGLFGVALGNSPGIGGDSSQIYLTYAVPEPGAAVIGSLGLLALLRRRRR